MQHAMAKQVFSEPGRILRFFKSIALSFYPDAYPRLAGKSLAGASGYLAGVLVLSFVATLLLLAFNAGEIHAGLSAELAKFEDLNVSISMRLSEPIVLDKQQIVIANSWNYSGERVLLTDEVLVRKPFLCMLVRPACWFRSAEIEVETESLENLAADRKRMQTIAVWLLLLLLPSMLIIYFLYAALRSLVVVLILSLIGILGARIFRYRLRYRQSLVIAVFSSTAMILADPFNLILWNLYYLHIAASLALFCAGAALVAERRRDA